MAVRLAGGGRRQQSDFARRQILDEDIGKAVGVAGDQIAGKAAKHRKAPIGRNRPILRPGRGKAAIGPG